MPSPYYSRRKKPSKRANFFGFLALAVCIVVLVFFQGGSLSREKVEAQLKLHSDQLSEWAATNHKESKLSFGDITIAGLGHDTHAIISNVEFALADKGQMETGKWSATTASVTVAAASTLEALVFAMPEPIQVLLNNNLKLTITPSAPIKYYYTDMIKNAVPTQTHNFVLPEQIDFKPVADGDKASQAQPFSIAYDSNPLVRKVVLPASKQRDIEMKFTNFRLIRDEADAVVAPLLLSHYTDQLREDGALEGTYNLEMNDMLLLQANGMMKPYSYAADVSFVQTPPKPIEGDAEGAASIGTTEVAVKSLSLVTNEFNINATGNIFSSTDDALLYGEGTIEISNAASFIGSSLVPMELKPIVEAALVKITGAPIGPETPVSITLKRDSHSPFFIGGKQFEELVTELLGDMLRSQPTITTLPEALPNAQDGAAPYAPVVSGPAGDLPAPPQLEIPPSEPSE